MAFPQGINFRATDSYVTDPADTTYEIGTTTNYPRTTPQGNSVGYETLVSIATRNRNTSYDPRIAGSHFNSNTTTANVYRFDLPAAGGYKVRVAMGDGTAGTTQKRLDLYDNASLLATICTTGLISGNTFTDATDTNYSAANWPANNALSSTLTFSSTIARFHLGPAGGGNCHYAHLYIEATGGGGDDEQDIESGGIASTIAIGTPSVHLSIHGAGGIASTVAIGEPSVTLPTQQTITLGGIASTVAVGEPSVTLSVQGAGGIASAAAVGEPAVSLSIHASGIASTAAVGTPTVIAPQTITVTGIAAGSAVGMPSVSVAGGPQTITVGGIASTVAIGTPSVELCVAGAGGIASAAAVGEPTLKLCIQGAGGIASGAVVGEPTVVAPQIVVVSGIPSTVRVGTPSVRRAGDLTDSAGGGPDEIAPERYTKDRSGWRKPKWLEDREREEREAQIAARQIIERARVRGPDATPAAPAPAAVPQAGLAHHGRIDVPAQPAPIAMTAAHAAAARRARQERDVEEILLVLMASR